MFMASLPSRATLGYQGPWPSPFSWGSTNCWLRHMPNFVKQLVLMIVTNFYGIKSWSSPACKNASIYKFSCIYFLLISQNCKVENLLCWLHFCWTSASTSLKCTNYAWNLREFGIKSSRLFVSHKPYGWLNYLLNKLNKTYILNKSLAILLFTTQYAHDHIFFALLKLDIEN
jgi:hypothetical protein